MVEIVIIEKAELVRLIDMSVSEALECVVRSTTAPEIMTKTEVATYLKRNPTQRSIAGCAVPHAAFAAVA